MIKLVCSIRPYHEVGLPNCVPIQEASNYGYDFPKEDYRISSLACATFVEYDSLLDVRQENILKELTLDLTRKHCQFFNVAKVAKLLSIKGTPNVRGEDLSSFIEFNTSPFKSGLVPKAWEVLRENVHKRGT